MSADAYAVEGAVIFCHHVMLTLGDGAFDIIIFSFVFHEKKLLFGKITPQSGTLILYHLSANIFMVLKNNLFNFIIYPVSGRYIFSCSAAGGNNYAL